MMGRGCEGYADEAADIFCGGVKLFSPVKKICSPPASRPAAAPASQAAFCRIWIEWAGVDPAPPMACHCTSTRRLAGQDPFAIQLGCLIVA